jgi:hypothetical protein
VSWGAITAGTLLDGIAYPDSSLDAIAGRSRANGAADVATECGGGFGAPRAQGPDLRCF